MKNIILRDSLNHHNYQWPRTLLSYPVKWEQVEEQGLSFVLTDEKQNVIAHQLDNIQKRPDGRTCASLSFTADLPSGGLRSYRFGGANDASGVSALCQGLSINEDADRMTLATSTIRLMIRKNRTADTLEKQPVFTIESPGEAITGVAYICQSSPIESYMAELSAFGDVFADCSIVVRFADGSCYKLKLRIIDGMEFVDMQEEMTGFSEDSPNKLLLEWNHVHPQSRYARYREQEPIDRYNGPDGGLPFHLLPYSSWCSWWGTPVASFTASDQGISAGIFVRQPEQWRHGEYALWGSPQATAIRFRHDPSRGNSGALSWEYPLVSGSRFTAVAIYNSEKNEHCEQKNYIEFLWFWYEFLNLNKVKDWILRWEEDRGAYPRFFPDESMPASGMEVWHYGTRKQPFTPGDVEKVIYELSHNMNQLYDAGPVPAREFFCWVYMFDMAAPRMTQRQFDDFKACCAFMAYAHMEEAFMPTKTVLSGHPNFLADTRSVPALMAALFPSHPHSRRWVDQFEIAMARNLKYHIRPEVGAWSSKGGRWTENLGCYNWASLVPMMNTSALLYRTFGDNVLMYPNLVIWTGWMLNSLSAPVDGKRTYPPQGAHSGFHQDPILPTSAMRLLAERLFHYEPLLAEYLLHLCKPDAPAFEERMPNANIFRTLYDSRLIDNKGTRPLLRSAKYTGYGYILRAAVGEESEVSVHLQQIDEGPNYRWGRAGQGGCGVIYYYAAGKRYSYNRPEDVGDFNMGDVQASSNFGVLVGHEYKSIGRNDLTEPMYDFGFAQYVQANAGAYARPFYQSRSVLLSGNDYIAVYDQVGDMRVRGRFAWFVKEGEEFPQIDQLKPGATGVSVKPGIPADVAVQTAAGGYESKGMVFDGSGDFLTVVTHRSLNCDYNTYTRRTEYGAEIKLQGRTDRVFRDGALIRHEDALCSFVGYAGIIRLYGESKAEAALFKGTSIGALGVKVVILPGSGGAHGVGISFTVSGGRLQGHAVCAEEAQIKVQWNRSYEADGWKLYVNALAHEASFPKEHECIFTLPKGSHTWEWTDASPVPQDAEITGTVVSSGAVEVQWKGAAGAAGYRVELSRDGGSNWTVAVAETASCDCVLSGLENGTKIHVRVQGFNENGRGNWSHDYPVYITEDSPSAPEGLKVWSWGAGFRIIWGKQLGVKEYRLYRRAMGTEMFQTVYRGISCEYIDTGIAGRSEIYEYAASACNGNGESGLSLLRYTAPDGLAYWDPQPEQGFCRYTRSHEYGYNGFDHWNNGLFRALHYPED